MRKQSCYPGLEGLLTALGSEQTPSLLRHSALIGRPPFAESETHLVPSASWEIAGGQVPVSHGYSLPHPLKEPESGSCSLCVSPWMTLSLVE